MNDVMRWMGALGLVTVAMATAGCAGPVGDGDGILTEDEIPEVGWIADLIGTDHDVAGTVEVIDERTLEISNFTYDGGGINARFFLLVDGAKFNRDIELTDNLVGTPFNDETLTLELPSDASLDDFNLISLWCIPAGVSFGAGVFLPPE